MNKINFDNFFKNNKYVICPHCEQKLKKGSKFCSTCGFVLENSMKKDQTEELYFGREEPSVAVKSDEIPDSQYAQKISKTTKVLKNLYTVMYFVIGIFSLLMIGLPLFSKSSNVWSYTTHMVESYKVSIPSYFKIDGFSNFFSILNTIFTYLDEPSKVLNPAFIMFIYDIIVALVTISIAIIGLLIILFSIVSLLDNKSNALLKRLVGISLALSMIMVFLLNCYGIAPILVVLSSISTLIILYIGGILSDEKPLLVRHLINKSVTLIVLLVLIVFSSIGLVNVNITLGGNLYQFLPINNNITLTPNLEACRGLFLELIQFVQCSSGDEIFTKHTSTLNLISCIFHIIYIVFGIFSFVDILKSLSKISIRFPVSMIIVSTITFYIFSFSLIAFNQLVNDAAFYNYLQEIGSVSNELSGDEIAILKQANRVFMISPRLIIAMFLYLPACIYSVIAKRQCLQNKKAAVSNF